MSTDFWAGYISGALGILIGNPLDLLKVRLQAGSLTSPLTTTDSTRNIVLYTSHFNSAGSLIRGATAPILGYGALNALLFMTYNRTSSYLTTGSINFSHSTTPKQANLYTTFLSGTLGGLATWVVSTPTELIKCRAQVSSSSASASSWKITKEILRQEGVRGLYFGGLVTAFRDSIGYGFYFWSYETMSRSVASHMKGNEGQGIEAAKVLLCGGLAGVITWASIFPLDVIKTRVQTQILLPAVDAAPLLRAAAVDRGGRRLSAIEVARNAYRAEGAGVFFKGLGICSIRAFIVNAAQWAAYEWIMRKLGPNRKKLKIDINSYN